MPIHKNLNYFLGKIINLFTSRKNYGFILNFIVVEASSSLNITMQLVSDD